MAGTSYFQANKDKANAIIFVGYVGELFKWHFN
jgi:hypothetical protein